MKVYLAALFLLFCSLSVPAQETKCTVKLAELPDAPELFGFRMGMNEAQVKARVAQVHFAPANDVGVAKTSINPDFDPTIDKASFNGIRTISLDFLDARVTSLWFGYDSTFKWHTVPEFVEGISRSLHLPNGWTEWKTRGQQINCADFQMTVAIVAEGPSFHIVDQGAEKTIAERRAAKEEEASAAEGGGEAEGQAEEKEADIVADRKDKVYYVEGCLPLHTIKESDRLVFKSREEAEKAGYKLAGRCR
jgi:hypothetical protein